jgi:hypothetical protein
LILAPVLDYTALSDYGVFPHIVVAAIRTGARFVWAAAGRDYAVELDPGKLPTFRTR